MERMKQFDEKVRKGEFNPEEMKKHARQFSKERFKDELFKFVTEKWEQHNA
jgi:hypothetical protein